MDEKNKPYKIYRDERKKDVTLVVMPVYRIDRMEDFKSKEIRDFVFSDGLREIGSRAFFSSQIHSAFFPASVANIEEGAFANCDKLKSVKFESNSQLSEISDECFKKCSALRSVAFPKNLIKIGKDAFRNTDLRSLSFPEGLKVISDGAFRGCDNLKSVQFSDYIEEIGDYAFKDCENLGVLILPSGLKKIGKGAFANIKDIISVILPKNITELSEDAFSGCTSLSLVRLPEKLEHLGRGAFQTSLSLKGITLPNGLKSIGESCFAYSGIRQISIPNSVKYIGQSAFTGTSLSEIKLSNNLIAIPADCFSECNHLRAINIPESVEVIEQSAFLSSGLIDIVLPDSIKVINQSAFQECLDLTGVKLPKNLKLISNSLFSGCENLQSIKIPDGVTEILYGAFENCRSLEHVKLSKNLQEIGVAAFRNCSALKEIEIPEGVKRIGSCAFEGCKSLKTVILPKSLEKIDCDAFINCFSLEKLVVQNGVIDEALNINHSIKEVRISKDCKCLTTRMGDLKYITKDGDYFVLTKKPLSRESFSLAGLKQPLSLEVVMALWDKRKALTSEMNSKKGSALCQLYNLLCSQLTKSQLSEFFDNKNTKYFNLISENSNFNGNLYKLFYNLGGFRRPEIEERTSKSGNQIEEKVDYAQKIGEFFKENIIGNLFWQNDSVLESMKIEGFKREFTNFFLNKENLKDIIIEEKAHTGFIARCYNNFNEVQTTNTTNKGNGRQLKPTVEKFKSFFDENKFENVTPETRQIADIVGKFYSKQDTFEDAVQIDMERKENKAPDNILGYHLKEDDVFGSINDYTLQIRQKAQIALGTLSDIANEQFSFDWLEKNDPYNFVIGKLAGCCAHLEGVGYGIMRAGIVLPNLQNLVLRDENNEIIAKATLYVNEARGYALFNTISARGKENLSKEELRVFFSKIKLATKLFVEEYNRQHPDLPIRIVNVGAGNNAITPILEEEGKKADEVLKNLNYQDYGKQGYVYNGDTVSGQFTLWEEDKKD